MTLFLTDAEASALYELVDREIYRIDNVAGASLEKKRHLLFDLKDKLLPADEPQSLLSNALFWLVVAALVAIWWLLLAGVR